MSQDVSAPEQPQAGAVAPGGRAAAARRAKVRDQILIWGIRLVFFVLLIGSWQYVSQKNIITPVTIGEPSGIWDEFIHLFTTSTVTTDLWTTLYETFVGMIISVVLGIAVAYWMMRSSLFRRTFYPLATAANAVPRIALVPVFIVWFGLGPNSKIINIVSFVFFLVLVNALAALTQTDRDLLLLARTLGFSERARMRKFVLPAAIPLLAGTMELALIYSFLGAIIGEMLGGYNGLGVSLETQANDLDTNAYFAILLLVVLLILIFVQLLQLVRKRLLRWSTIEMRGSDAHV